tara:strand:- start:197 stop:370 length:174 start_codon:yes stop_codon:yes gene_type:complete
VAKEKQPIDNPKIKTENKASNKKVPLETEITKELGGPKGLEPTRYGDWEKKGRCSDF